MSSYNKKHRQKDNIPDNFYLVGISTTLKIYNLATLLNPVLDTRFAIDTHIPGNFSELSLEFQRFRFTSDSMVTYELISNRMDNYSLLKHLHQFDILLRITGQIDGVNLHNIIYAIRNIDHIHAAYLLNDVKPGYYSSLLKH